MNLFSLLFFNLTLFISFCFLAYFATWYNKAWYLRTQRTKYVYNNFYEKFILLEIKLPREITKSPQAMEFIIDAFYQMAGNPSLSIKPGDGFFKRQEKKKNYMDDAYHQGQTRLWMTMEIESRGGEIHFYIGTTKRYKEIISSYIFSQYPGIEVTETPDYTDKIRAVEDGGKHIPFTSYGALTDASKDYLPIKTYIDYGLDKDPKDEHKIDPLIPLLESMANIKEDEHVWFQILVRAAIGGGKLKADAEKRIDDLLGIKRDDHKKIIEQSRDIPKLLPKEKLEIELIHRLTDKLLFETNIKLVYWGTVEGGSRAEGTEIIRNALKSFNSQNYNSFRTANQNTSNSYLDYPDKRREKAKKAGWTYLYITRNPLILQTGQDGTPFASLLKKYKKFGFRSAKEYLFDDFKSYFSKFNEKETEMGLSFILNSEELVTIYHFPSKAFSAPKFARVESVKSEPPTNLPI